MRGRIECRCRNGHRWQQYVEFAETGAHVQVYCAEQDEAADAEIMRVGDMIRHCPDCGEHFSHAEGEPA